MNNEFWIIALVLGFLYLMSNKKHRHRQNTATAAPGPTSDPNEDLTPSRPLTVREAMQDHANHLERQHREGYMGETY